MTILILVPYAALALWCWALSSRNYELNERLMNLEYPLLKDDVMEAYLMGQAETTTYNGIENAVQGNDMPEKSPKAKKRSVRGDQ
jgi:hypothetical protein